MEATHRLAAAPLSGSPLVKGRVAVVRRLRESLVIATSGALLAAMIPAAAALPGNDSSLQSALAGLTLDRVEDGVVVSLGSDVVAELDAQAEEVNALIEVDDTALVINANVPEFSPDGYDIMPLLSWAADGNQVYLMWDSAGPTATYVVFRDDLQIGETEERYFVDSSAAPGTVHEYAVEAVVDRASYAFEDTASLDWHPVDVEISSGGGYGLPGEDATMDEEEEDIVVVMVSPVAVPATADMASLMEARGEMSTMSSHTSRMRHTTFIPMAKVSKADTFACIRTSYGRQFRGDDRGYSATHSRFRTRLQANIYWGDRRVTKSRWVNDTVLLNSNGTVHSRKNAGTSNMDVYYSSFGSSSVRIRFKHSKGNPYCANTGGQIKYEWSGTVYSGGSYSISGEHRKAPSHEIYLRRTATSSWHTVYRRDHVGFNCLVFGACATYKIDKSGRA